LKTSSTITELENYNILATKNDPPASNTAATLPVLTYAITPAIRCAPLDSPSKLNFKPKLPSVMRHSWWPCYGALKAHYPTITHATATGFPAR